MSAPENRKLAHKSPPDLTDLDEKPRAVVKSGSQTLKKTGLLRVSILWKTKSKMDPALLHSITAKYGLERFTF